MTPFNGAHTTFPMPKMPIAEFAKDAVGAERDIVMIVDEQIRNACEEPRQMAWFVDVTIEAHPMVISNFQVPEASGEFCSRGGRFGTHASNESMAPIFYKKIVFLSYFNAGVRAVDVRDPYHPKEIGYFIPAITAATDKRCVKLNGQDSCKIAIQTNNVETDDRGYIYIVDRANTGMHILELTGEARAVATAVAADVMLAAGKCDEPHASNISLALSVTVGALAARRRPAFWRRISPSPTPRRLYGPRKNGRFRSTNGAPAKLLAVRPSAVATRCIFISGRRSGFAGVRPVSPMTMKSSASATSN